MVIRPSPSKTIIGSIWQYRGYGFQTVDSYKGFKELSSPDEKYIL